MSRTRQRPRTPTTTPAAPPLAHPPDAAGTTATPSLPGHTAIGVGIDTSRYGHYATFLRPDLQPAAADLKFVESAQGYQELRRRLDTISQRHGPVHFHIRLDVAGRYADNLLAFLHQLPEPKTISCGDPQRNKNYRAAIFGQKKSDPVESAAAARYALTEKPKPTPVLTPALRLLCQIASRLESQARQVTRLVNQLHNLLARAFPELALLVNDFRAGWVLALLERYPTAANLAGARAATLERIPYLPHQHIPTLLEYARTSVASLLGPFAEQLVRDQVRQTKDAQVRQQSLETMLGEVYRQLPEPNHLDTIVGFGEVTAAILTAKMVRCDRFSEPAKLVGYFGAFPVEASSGIDRDGKQRIPKRYVMSQRGNDLVRRYLYMAALSACQHNPAVRPLYQRVRAKHPDKPGLAIGHAMRKLLHLALAVWKTGKPFDRDHYDWEKTTHLPGSNPPAATAAIPLAPPAPQENPQAAGHNTPETTPGRSVVTAACASSSATVAPAQDQEPTPQGQPGSELPSSTPVAAAGPWIDFAHLKAQLPLARVLEHLGLWGELRGTARQRRGPCPLHRQEGPSPGRTFSVNLEQQVFRCFEARCGMQGDVIDLWAAVKGLSLREAALELVRTFNLEPAP